jgi:hypothetical protein
MDGIPFAIAHSFNTMHSFASLYCIILVELRKWNNSLLGHKNRICSISFLIFVFHANTKTNY